MKYSSENALQWLQTWYSRQTNGAWEHAYGIEIATLDNPGWRIRIDLEGTSLDEVEFPPFKVERSEDDWVHYRWEDYQFFCACGPLNLEEAILLFHDLVERYARSGE